MIRGEAGLVVHESGDPTHALGVPVPFALGDSPLENRDVREMEGDVAEHGELVRRRRGRVGAREGGVGPGGEDVGVPGLGGEGQGQAGGQGQGQGL